MNYQQFLESKTQLYGNYGFKPLFIPDYLFDFQKYVFEHMVLKGRSAGFLDTGLGKTAIQLVLAFNIVKKTNKPILILTPLAVAYQFIIEAEKIGIDDIEHSKDGKYKSKIVITNYERLHYFDWKEFSGVLLDESSILKNFDGAIKSQITSFMRKIKYRYLSTATPSPNDYIELGTSSEALGYLGYIDMLGKFFKNNNNSIDPKHAGEKWYLKPHATNDFWKWVASWSISLRKPSDIGFSDDRYILPELIENETIIRNEKPISRNGQTSMFSFPAVNFFDIKQEVRSTINERCEKAFQKAIKHDISVYWCNLNDESSLLAKLDNNAVEIKGSMSIDKKEDILMNFSSGNIKKLITKTSITAFGLNWQHCNHTTYFPTYSYEQYYQAIRRFWRFGQKNKVNIDLILSDGQIRIMETLKHKKENAIKMFDNLVGQTNVKYDIQSKNFNKNITKPKFLS